VEEAFFYVLVAVVVLSAIAALVSLRGDRYGHVGRGGFEQSRPPQETAAVRDEEVRQMLEAANIRRAARGQPPLDVEAELARLTRPAADAALVAEIRSLVEARNARRARRGDPPLDVEAEVRRQLDDLMG
jgi:hypothetical protein